MHLSRANNPASKTPTTATLSGLPSGPAGVLATLKAMRRLVRQGKKSLPVRSQAANIVQHLPGKDFSGEIRAVHQWVKSNIRYVKDINGVETLTTPEKILELRHGDCDDQAVLVAALLESIGHPTRFVAIGFNADNYKHVYAETLLGNKWLSVETTEPVNVGWQPRGVRARMVVHNR